MFKRLMTALLALASTILVGPSSIQIGRSKWPSRNSKVFSFFLLCLFSTASFAQSSVNLTITSNMYVGDTGTLTATVSGNNPTGTVTFYAVQFYNQVPTILDTAPLNGGVATLSKVFTTAVVESITAVYSGDDNNGSATSPAARLSVSKKPTITNVTVSSTTLQAGQALTVTATVTGDNPTGSVNFNFFIGNKWYLASAMLANGQATITAPSYTTATVGAQSVMASYTTDAVNADSMSSVIPYTVSAPNGNVLPTVSITTPTNNASFVGPANITVTASANDPDGTIDKVEFFNGSTLLATVTEAPYEYTWDVAWGMSSIMAVATDNKGATAASQPVTIIVTPNVPPTVSLSSPADNASFTAPAGITLTADAADSDGSISQVAFYHGDVFIGSTTSAPYTLSWPDVPAGSYEVTAVATDNLGSSVTSAPISVTVAASDSAAQIYYIHADHLNTPRLITDSGNTTVWEWNNSDPFGSSIPVTNSGFTFNLRFPGQYFDRETGLSYNYYRDYDPSLGRYLESDPLGLGGGINTYAYVESNPLFFIDDNGLTRKTVNLGSGYTGGVDTFDYSGQSSFEIHVYDAKGKEVGIYGPNGWINKHGKVGAPEGLPEAVENQCRGQGYDWARRAGYAPQKGTQNIKGTNVGEYMKAGGSTRGNNNGGLGAHGGPFESPAPGASGGQACIPACPSLNE